MNELYTRATAAAEFLRQYQILPDIWVILGSGLGSFASTLKKSLAIPYADIPHFPRPTVTGHGGKLILGQCGEIAVGVMQGRCHYYEGYSLEQVTFPIRVAGLLGVQRLVITNAAGGLNPDFVPGDLMLITDHINLLGMNPLQGQHEARFGDRFLDLSQAYQATYRELALKAAAEMNLTLRQGVYVALPGPSFETPAEVRMLRALGGDAVGMSTVPEVIVGRQMGVQILGISCITNLAAGIGSEPVNHREVLEVGEQVSQHFCELLQRTLPRLCLV